MTRLPFLFAFSLVLISGFVTFGDEPSKNQSGQSTASTRIDYHAVRGREAINTATGLYEGEMHLKMQGKSQPQPMQQFGPHWSGDAHMLWNGLVNDQLITQFDVEKSGRYRLSIQLTKAPDYGVFSAHLNGKEIAKAIDLYAPRVELAKLFTIKEISLEAGKQDLVYTLTNGNEKARKYQGTGYLMGLDFVKLVDLDPPKEIELANNQPETTLPVAPMTQTQVRFEEIKPLLSQYCYRCHSGDDPEGELDLKQFASKSDLLANIKTTQKIALALQKREMPPEDEKQLPDTEHKRLTSQFHTLVDQYLQSTNQLEPVVMRRLNRYEYNNAVRDLLKLKGDVYPLPEKVIRATRPYFDPITGQLPAAVLLGNRTIGKNQIEKKILTGVSPFAIDLQAEHGFNNRGEELSVSPILLESFLKLGTSIVYSPEFDDYCELTPSFFQSPVGKSIDQQVEIAENRLRDFLEVAFRSHVEQSTLQRYVNFFAFELKRTEDFSQSMKNVASGVLASPRFLYLMEQVPRTEKEQTKATPYELATRLSFFLWSSIPDEELLSLAKSGELTKPVVLEAQIRRMLEDPRSQALSENFARQWLRLDQLITAVPDFERFEIYYSRLGCEQWKFGMQMMVEPLLLFESIMVEDRSIMLLVDSNYSYRSDELQAWYMNQKQFQQRTNRGRFNVFQQAYRKQKLDTRRQGGVITSAAMLTMTSGPLRTQPITRGAWIATVIFNQPPPPPPDVVPEIEADDAGIEAQGFTLRERLEQHKVNQSCASCHAKIDPLGFALENYDAIGRWRDTYQSGLAIDASGQLFGEDKFTDIIGLKDAILDHPEWFMRAFSEHLLSYSLGRELEVEDKPAVDRILRNVMADDGQFSTVVMQIATSYPFLHKSKQTKHKSE